MERFVQLIVAGGLSLLAGLWILEIVGEPLAAQIVAVGLVLAGLAGLGVGIWTEVDV